MYRDDITAATTIPPIATSSNSDLRLCEILVEKFEHKHNVAICEDPKAMMKLRKEADRLNAILSANTKVSAQHESAFESVCADMKDWFVQPIFDALNNSNLTLHTKSIKLSDIALYFTILEVDSQFLSYYRLVAQERGPTWCLSRQWGSSRSVKRGNGQPLFLVTPVRLRHLHSLIKMETEEAAIATREEQRNIGGKTSSFRWPNNGEGGECSSLRKTGRSPEVLQPASHCLFFDKLSRLHLAVTDAGEAHGA
ncbi:hypothetical protein EDB84DRAFT_1682278 [Lactarius hengduanensis]|nr:hypothetical protein EDB84DRAFT_1682278 [Lactarius hengduanensis]